jgi:hypothetical protein
MSESEKLSSSSAVTDMIALEEQFFRLSCLVEAMSELVPDNPPSWLLTLQDHLKPVSDALDTASDSVRKVVNHGR